MRLADLRFWGVLGGLTLLAVFGVWWASRYVPHSDVLWFQEWTRAAESYNYSNLRAVSSFNYLPPFVAVLWLSNLFESALRSAGMDIDFLQYWRYFTFAGQLLLTGWLVLAARPLLNEKQRLWLAGLVLFNPVFIWVMWVWGQIDLLIILPWLTSFFYLAQRKWWGFGWATLLAICLKPTGILLLPATILFLVVTIIRETKYRSWLRHGWWIVLLCSLIGLPLIYLLSGYLSQLQSGSAQTYLTYNTYNLWFLLPNYGMAQDTWQGLSYQMWSALALFLALYLFLCIFFGLVARPLSKERLLFVYTSFAAIYAYLFTYLLTDMHERYWDFSLAAFLVGAILYRPWRGVAAILSITFFLNFVLIFPSSFPSLQALQIYWVEWGKLISQFHGALIFVLFAIWATYAWRLKTHKD